MNIHVWPSNILEWQDKPMRCSLGHGGIVIDKCEGDGASPEGIFALRQVMYRPDRLKPPQTRLPLRKITPNDAWCDDASSSSYNQLVQLPFSAGHELLWREENVYDVIVELGYNDEPIIAGKGSAIFMHVAKPDYKPTAGCIALALKDLLKLLNQCDEHPQIHIHIDPK